MGIILCFANVFINANLEQRSTGEEPIDYGSDIFPKHFIKMSISPSNHLGPNNLFDERHPEDNNYPSHFNEAHKRENVMPNAPLENRMLRLLPRSRDLKARDYIDDEELLKDREGLDWQHPECFPYGQKELIERLPESLMYAVRVFILSLAINNIERKNEHHNMIVNVSVNQTRQREVAALIHDYKRQISDDLFINAKMDETKSTFLSQLQKDYIKEFSNSEFDWSEIKDSMQDSIKNVDVIVVNSEGQEIIYEDPSNENFKPTIKIIVGGHKLSRGITIKGLAVSYIARRANAADTLLQIGRFFGYRNETRHITRIFLTEDVYEYYQEINRTLEELRVFIRTMNLSEYDPKEFGIRIRDCFGINLTSKQKQRSVDHITVTSNLAGKRISAHSIRHENQYNEKNRELEDVKAELASAKNETPTLCLKSPSDADQMSSESRKRLKNSLQLLKEENVFQTKQLSIMKRELENTELLIQKLQEENEALSSVFGEDPAETGETSHVDLSGKRVLYVGGKPHALQRLRSLIENWNGEFIHHDGGIEKSLNELGSAVRKADAVVFPTDCISHSAVNKIKQTCKRMMKPYIPLRTSGTGSLAAGVTQNISSPAFFDISGI